VSNLRKLLTGAGVDSRTVLIAAPPGYRLNIPDDACDLDRFTAEKTAGVHAAAAGSFEQAARHLSAALAEWRGPVLGDLEDFRFVNAFTTSLVEEKILAHMAQAEAEIACGRAFTVITELEAHAVIVDTGTGYIIDDLRSSNGVHVQDQRIRSAATLRDGDRVRICDRVFAFQIAVDNGNER
jgi:hypothetical protein